MGLERTMDAINGHFRVCLLRVYTVCIPTSNLMDLVEIHPSSVVDQNQIITLENAYCGGRRYDEMP
jgi:hypothetical protein